MRKLAQQFNCFINSVAATWLAIEDVANLLLQKQKQKSEKISFFKHLNKTQWRA
jgi:hypothetical protein